MARYQVHEAVTAEVHHFMLGACTASFAAGEVIPKSEEETVVLEQLVAGGQAALIEADPPSDPAIAPSPAEGAAPQSAVGADQDGASTSESAPAGRKRTTRSRS